MPKETIYMQSLAFLDKKKFFKNKKKTINRCNILLQHYYSVERPRS
jgi:hypothetical protein